MRINRKEIFTIILFVVFMFVTLILPYKVLATPVPDTGQTRCYNNTYQITCPQPGQPFYGQDAQYPCNPQSYTKLDENGNDLPDDATTWVMVRDNVTGLIWENKTDDGSIHDWDADYDWDYAQSVFITNLNNDNFGGYSDWRLPTVMELSFLVDSERYDPCINTTYFPNTSSEYWSSTTYAALPNYAWNVNFYSGGVNNYYKFYGDYVRAVRSGQCGSFDNFIDNGDGTVSDFATGLMWEQKTDDGGLQDKDNTYSWQEALSYCENLSLAGHSDWRLPNRNELQSIVDYYRYNPSIDTTFFPNTSSEYWTSTTYDSNPNYAWYVSFDYSYVLLKSKSSYVLPKSKFSSYYYYVRAVRGGQCGSLDTSTTTTLESTTTTTIPESTTTIVQPCLTESIYGKQSEQTELLRYFRDNVLSQSPEGQEIIRLYYEWSPMVVNAMEADEEFKKEVKEMIDGVLILLEWK
jgi:hypothetical protein